MDKAEKKVDWVDLVELWEAKRRRDAVAHDGTLHDSKQCQKDVMFIGNQLVAWGVLDGQILP